MPWDRTPGTRRRLPPNWAALRRACRDAAGGRCEKVMASGARCPRPGVEADHYGAPDDHTRLRWLCADHHKEHTAEQARRARTRTTPTRPRRPHPGSLR